jgi:glycosyltransferase involved in cell wall biosynthesis
MQLILVDDGSTDATVAKLMRVLPEDAVLIKHDTNLGKAAAIRSGLTRAKGEWVVIQDADLEYDPAEIHVLLEIANRCDCESAVYGRRPAMWHAPNRWVFALGVWLIDLALWWYYGRLVRDNATCYKLITRRDMQAMQLQTSSVCRRS